MDGVINMVSQRFMDQVVFISGGAGGMGQVHARRFAEEGAHVLVADLNEEAGRALAEELGPRAAFLHLDVTQEQSWRDAVTDAESRFGPISVLVNNAGIVGGGFIDEMEPSLFRRIMEINHTGAFLGIRAVCPSMRKAGGGSIINISSVTGLAPVPVLAAYTASKHALVGLTKVAALDLARHGIRVNCVNPGIIDTGMLGDVDAIIPRRQPIPRIGKPDEVTNMVMFLASDQAAFCTGATYVIDGGFLAVVGDAT